MGPAVTSFCGTPLVLRAAALLATMGLAQSSSEFAHMQELNLSEECMLTESMEYPYPHTKDTLGNIVDNEYPGTATERLISVLQRVSTLGEVDLSGEWGAIRRRLLHVGGLKDASGTTGHAFNDDNHCDLTTMAGSVQAESNANGAISQISRNNQLGPHIQRGSLQGEGLGQGGSWSTCTNGAHILPRPNDVAHTQFRARIAFKLVWLPPTFSRFALVDDVGRILKLSGDIVFGGGRDPGPSLHARQRNYKLVQGGIYDPVKKVQEVDGNMDKSFGA